MADNVIAASSDAQGPTFATREDGGTHFPVDVIALTNAGSGATPVSASNPVPVTGTITANMGTVKAIAVSASANLPVSGVVLDAIEDFVSAAATGIELLQTTVSGGRVETKISEISGNVPVTGTVTATIAGQVVEVSASANIGVSGAVIDQIELHTSATWADTSAIRADTSVLRTNSDTITATVSGGRVEVKIDEVSGNVPVEGTVTSNLGTIGGAATQATLADVETNTDYGATIGGGTEAAALRVTLANNSTGLVSVDDNNASLTIDNADITTIAGIVSGATGAVDVKDGAVAARTDMISDNGTELTPKFAKVSAVEAGATIQVAKVAAKKLRVIAYDMIAASGGTVQWFAGSGGGTAKTDITGQYTFPASGGGISKDGYDLGYFETHASASGLALSAIGGGVIGGVITYVEV